MQRVILTTGGTGGHIFPALAVAEELKARNPQARILFVGGVRGPEAELAARSGLEFTALPVRPVLGRGLKALTAGFWLTLGVAKALAVQLRFKPQVVLGLGGYAAFAQVLAAVLTGTPSAIQEQNSVPGLTNRLLGRFVKQIYVSFEDKDGRFPAGKVKLLGNPVRKTIREAATQNGTVNDNAGIRPKLLILGGSQGAMAVNTAVIEALDRFREAGVEIWHQAGARDYERVRQAYTPHLQKGLQAKVDAFIDDMAAAYAWGDLALCRAGATTVAELTVAGLPSVLVPFPYATHNHQSVNAGYLENVGAAKRVEQKDMEKTDLPGLVLGLLQDRQTLWDMGAKAASLGKPEAAAHIVDAMESLAKGK